MARYSGDAKGLSPQSSLHGADDNRDSLLAEDEDNATETSHELWDLESEDAESWHTSISRGEGDPDSQGSTWVTNAGVGGVSSAKTNVSMLLKGVFEELRLATPASNRSRDKVRVGILRCLHSGSPLCGFHDRIEYFCPAEPHVLSTGKSGYIFHRDEFLDPLIGLRGARVEGACLSSQVEVASLLEAYGK